MFWPWLAAGAAGKVSVVWYQSDRIADLDCQVANVSVYDANVTGATTTKPSVTAANAVGRPIHRDSTVCQGATTCVATGQDRRLGDFLTNSLDERGCVMIGTGDTMGPDPLTGGPRPISLPLFVHQTSGPSLTTGKACTA